MTEQDRMPSRRIQSLRGSLILDGGQLSGSYFHRTVVLVCQHDAKGAFGLVLNRVDDRRLGRVLDVEVPERLAGLPLHEGGPVQPTALSYLLAEPVSAPVSNVMDVIRLGHDVDGLVALEADWKDGRRLRAFAGYAGWAPGQLDDEMRRESWLVHPATLEWVFDVDPSRLWREILRSRAAWQERLLADSPDDLNWN